DAVHVRAADGVGGNGGHHRRIDAAAHPEHHRVEPVLADVVAVASTSARQTSDSSVSGGVRPSGPVSGRSGTGGGSGATVRSIGMVEPAGKASDSAAGSSSSTRYTPSTNCGARASRLPSAATTNESPSKTSSSWPPTWLT